MQLLKNVNDINSLRSAVAQCRGDVMVRSMDGSEEFNMKSAFSEYLAIGKLCGKNGDEYEFFCRNASDESKLFRFFKGLN